MTKARLRSGSTPGMWRWADAINAADVMLKVCVQMAASCYKLLVSTRHHLQANMIFVDSPLNVGFSYTEVHFLHSLHCSKWTLSLFAMHLVVTHSSVNSPR